MRREAGFTLIELLVVILVIAILAAIAIPGFLEQRNKAEGARVQAALKNAALAAETYGNGNGGDFGPLDGGDSSASNAPYALLVDEGFRTSSSIRTQVASPTGNEYCITASNSKLPAADAWRIATYNASGGQPVPVDTDAC